MMGDKDWQFAGTPGSTIRFSSFKMQKGDYVWRQGLAICRNPRRHHTVLKLQEGRQEETMMGDKN